MCGEDQRVGCCTIRTPLVIAGASANRLKAARCIELQCSFIVDGNLKHDPVGSGQSDRSHETAEKRVPDPTPSRGWRNGDGDDLCFVCQKASNDKPSRSIRPINRRQKGHGGVGFEQLVDAALRPSCLESGSMQCCDDTGLFGRRDQKADPRVRAIPNRAYNVCHSANRSSRAANPKSPGIAATLEQPLASSNPAECNARGFRVGISQVDRPKMFRNFKAKLCRCPEQVGRPRLRVGRLRAIGAD